MAILETANLQKHFGGLLATQDVSIQVEEGSITSIIGPNGAGKTTLFNLLTGFYKPDAGRIIIDGTDVTGWPIHRIVALGVARSFQILNIFNEISPFENVRLAVQSRQGIGLRFLRSTRNFPEVNKETEAVLDFIGLAKVQHIPTKNLSYGDKRILEIGIALASKPRLILMDEPSSGLPSSETERVKEFITKISKNLTIVVIEHDMEIVLSLSDKIIVLHQGHVIAQGSPQEIQANQDVQEAYLGGVK
jgi:ABC-type branched-subunit amino acid transport system ATPase component